MSADLGLAQADLDKCVQCGLCLPHCPTYRVSGDETMGPRGRISLMRAVQVDGAPLTEQVREAFDTCVQCRGCEPACPSAVPYGKLISQTKAALTQGPAARGPSRRLRRWALRAALAPLSRPRLLRALSTAGALAARLRLMPRRLALGTRELRLAAHRVSGDDVYLFTGCVMDTWQRDVHHSTQRVLEAAGVGVTPTGDRAPCCGSLHHHAGLVAEARARAVRTIEALSGDERPVLVNSSGCGAAMKEYGELLGTEQARAFAAKVFDVHEWLADRSGLLERAAAGAEPLDVCVAVQDPCHLRHVQRSHEAVRAVLAPFVRKIVELDDDGLCCGAGGAYSLLQPGLAGEIRERKLAAIAHVDPDVVASANPGCSMHLAAGDADGVSAEHPMTLIARALDPAR